MDSESDNQNVIFEKMVDNVAASYHSVAFYHIQDGKDVMLSDGNSPQKCRFCGREEGATTFNKVAHAVSHMVENRHLKSDYECDKCNELFASYESDFGAFMNIYHTMFRVHGKGGIPKYKISSSQNSKIEMKDNTIKINVQEGEDPLVIWEEEDKANNKIKIKGKRTYTPQNVLKALTKMALSIAPADEMPNFKGTIDWLLNKKCDGMMLPIVIRFYRQTLPFTSCLLFKKKNSEEVVPEYIFLLVYRNIVVQCAIPMVEADKTYKGMSVDFKIIPTPLDEFDKPFCVQKCRLSSTEKVKGEEVEIGLSYDAVEEKKIEVAE